MKPQHIRDLHPGIGGGQRHEQHDISRMEETLRLHRVRALVTTALGSIGVVFGVVVGLYTSAIGVALLSGLPNPYGLTYILPAALLVVALEMGFLTMCVAPAAWSAWRMMRSRRTLLPRLTRLKMRQELHGVPDERLQVALSLTALLDALGHGAVANEALSHVRTLVERRELIRTAADVDTEVLRTRELIDSQLNAVVGQLGTLAFAAAQGDQGNAEHLEAVATDFTLRAQAATEVRRDLGLRSGPRADPSL